MADAPSLVLLHTAAAHQASFEALVTRLAPEVEVEHLVDDSLLADAMAAGSVTPDIKERLAGRLGEAGATGAAVILCTCSTLGGSAESLGQDAGLNVLRIDRAMAEKAVDEARTILVAACIETTLGPTMALLEGVAADREKSPTLRPLLIEGAWTHFLAGDLPAYHQAIAESLRANMADAEVAVLAQASMAPAAALLKDLPQPILSSPELGLRQALSRLSPD